MSELFTTAIVEKRNILNELRNNNMTLQELRFFSIYLSKINSRDISTRAVRFPLNDFVRIMDIGSDVNINHFRYTIRHILQHIVEVPNESGSGYTAFQLFKQAEIEKDKNGDWYVEIDTHDKALPLMFEFKERYFKYQLWNVLRLKSANQLRMYEILKQYEGLRKREINIAELREMLGIKKNEYTDRTGWSDFKRRVLDSCQKALRETTDICYTYERGKVGRGGKWLSIVFHIKKNKDYSPIQLTLDDFIDQQPQPEESSDQLDFYSMIDNNAEVPKDSLGELLADTAFNNEFTKEQVRVLQDLVLKNCGKGALEIDMCDYALKMYHRLNEKAASGTQIISRYNYLRKMFENDEI